MTQQKNEGKEDGRKKKVVTVELIKWKIDKQLKMLRKNKLLSKVCPLRSSGLPGWLKRL